MSTKDKTRQKLVDSMRRTKASALEKNDDSTETPATKAAPTTDIKQPVRQSTASSSAQNKTQKDPYQSARRIWPD